MGKSFLVCGGAGYIGSHMARLLAEQGHTVTVFDNLSSGHAEAVPPGSLIPGDLLDPEALERLFAPRRFDAVFHFAALIEVGESVKAPDRYYRNNVVGTLNLLDAMRRAGVDRFVFSSSAAVYGNPLTERLAEGHPLAPINPYGWTKRMVEQVLADQAAAYGLRSVSFRYFNAAGAHPDGGIGEAHEPESHLIPNVLFAALGRREVGIFGDDYPTPDGTCVRDYVHVVDLCQAHLAAIDWMDRHPGAHAFNLGSGNGFSIRQVIESVRAVTGREVPHRIESRRAGDPAVLVADSTKARSQLGWTPLYGDLAPIIETAWHWHRGPGFPRGRA